MSDTLYDLMMMRISQRLDDLGLTMITAATEAGLPRDTIRNLYRKPGSMPRADNLISIARALNTNVSFLLGENVLASIEVDDRNSVKIPVIGQMGTEIWISMKGDPDQFIHCIVPFYQQRNLMALQIATDEYSPQFMKDSFIIFTSGFYGGFRDGDFVVFVRMREKDGDTRALREYTIWRCGMSDHDIDGSIAFSPLPVGDAIDLQDLLSVGTAFGPIVATQNVDLRGAGRALYLPPFG